MHWMQMVGIGVGTGSVVLNIVQVFHERHERKVFAGKVVGVYQALAGALWRSRALVTTTDGLTGDGDEGHRRVVLRKVSINAGRVEGAITSVFLELSGFGQKYLKEHMVTWKEIVTGLEKQGVQEE